MKGFIEATQYGNVKTLIKVDCIKFIEEQFAPQGSCWTEINLELPSSIKNKTKSTTLFVKESYEEIKAKLGAAGEPTQ